MSQRVIPIRPVPVTAPTLLRTAQSGDAGKVQRVSDALETAVSRATGLVAAAWLRELHLHDGEAFVSVAPGLGQDGVESARIAFDTLRRLLPDTDIFVGVARA